MIHGPISKYSFAVNVRPANRSKDSRIVRTIAMVAHHKIIFSRNRNRAITRTIQITWRNINFLLLFAVHIQAPTAQLDRFPRQTNYSLDKRLRLIKGIPEHDHVAPLNRLEPVHKFVDKNALLIAQQRRHAGAFHFHRLVEENYDYQRKAQRHSQIARPAAQLSPQLRNTRVVGWSCRARVRGIKHSSPNYL